MPWNKNDYPDSMKNLDADVRDKAIEIANALLKDNYEEGRAISIATSQARKAIHGDDENRITYEVISRESDWVLMKADGRRAIFVEDTKEDLLQKAKPYVNEQNGILIIYEEDGSVEDTLYE
ncbi:DUF2188 domain-containing protein [Psychrobacillus sp. NPDC096623]|uniref:DUF2188 domain-containing protein n=1 Tax=Psychrobacillus sp. NPDC096623 TaxID=3364492 RepID=UPI0037F4C716